MDKPIFSDSLVFSRKAFFFDMKENEHGRFLKITEKRQDMRNAIKVAEEDLRTFSDKITEIVTKLK